MFDLDTNFLIVVAVYCVVVGIMRIIGFEKVLDAHDRFWRKVILRQEFRESEYDLSKRLRENDCIGLHRTARREEDLYGMVISGELATHLDYCKRYTFDVPYIACKHRDVVIDMALDGSATTICKRCGWSEFAVNARRNWEGRR